MKHRTADLEGALLDAAVAMAEGERPMIERHAIPNPDPVRNMVCWIATPQGAPDVARGPFRPSTDWAQGGPIIERERIATEAHDYRPAAQRWQAMAGAPLTGIEPCLADGAGPTALIAAMRAYVASNFGEEVELP